MAIPAGSEGLTRKSTADWLTDTKTYLQGERLLDIDTGEQRVSSGGTYAQAWKNLPYLSYVAAISQSGTDDPTAEVNYNTLSGTPVWSRAAEGSYAATLVGAFPAGKTRCFINGGSINGDDLSIVALMERSSDDACGVTIRLASDGTTSADLVGGPSISLEIRVYP